MISFGFFYLLTLPILKWGSLLILAMLGVLGWLLLNIVPDGAFIFAAGRFVLIFTALLCTMTLVKNTAITMPSVQKSQQQLAKLPPESSSTGLQLAAHAFGGIINTGAFAMLSAALPPDSDLHRRKIAAEAAMRGMVTSAVWSPFFIAFAVGQGFVGTENSWIAIGIGLITASIFTIGCTIIFTNNFSIKTITTSLGCLKPVSMRLLIVVVAVLTFALAFNFTALSAVVVVMPLLVLVQFLHTPHLAAQMIKGTKNGMANISDDLIIITSAMIIAFIATNTNGLEALGINPDGIIPGWVALIGTPLVMMLTSTVGIHPVISSSFLLTIFSNGGADVHPALLMQSFLIGWSAGTISSVASLSMIICANLYQVPGPHPRFWR